MPPSIHNTDQVLENRNRLVAAAQTGNEREARDKAIATRGHQALSDLFFAMRQGNFGPRSRSEPTYFDRDKTARAEHGLNGTIITIESPGRTNQDLILRQTIRSRADEGLQPRIDYSEYKFDPLQPDLHGFHRAAELTFNTLELAESTRAAMNFAASALLTPLAG